VWESGRRRYLSHNLRAEHPFVARPTSWGLFICAKNLLIGTKAPQAPAPKPFDLDQNFEPSARNRRPTAVGAALKMREVVCLMSLAAWMRPRRPPFEPR